MNVSDQQIPPDVNFADYCDALRNADYARFILVAKQAQKSQTPTGVKQQETVSSDERASVPS